MKNFEMCSTPWMACMVANYMIRIPMGDAIMASSGLEFVFKDFDPNDYKWEEFRRRTREVMAKNPDTLKKSDWLALWKTQHEDLFNEWFGDIALSTAKVEQCK